MEGEAGGEGVGVGGGAMGNRGFFRTLGALERGEEDRGPPSLAEKLTVWRRHASLVLEHSPEKMRVHELRKTLAWYSRGLFGGSHLRQRGFAVDEAPALLELGETFFADLEARDRAGRADVRTSPAHPTATSIA